jgi:hypothetical protein
MQHDVDSVHGGRAERPVVAAATPQQMRGDVVDVGGGQLGDRYVAEVRPGPPRRWLDARTCSSSS